MSNKFQKNIVGLLMVAPFFASADKLTDLINKFKDIVAAVIPLALGVLSIVFLYNVIQFALAGADENKRAGARQMMIYTVVGMFVAVAVWGLVSALGEFLGVTVGGDGTTIDIPAIHSTSQ